MLPTAVFTHEKWSILTRDALVVTWAVKKPPAFPTLSSKLLFWCTNTLGECGRGTMSTCLMHRYRHLQKFRMARSNMHRFKNRFLGHQKPVFRTAKCRFPNHKLRFENRKWQFANRDSGHFTRARARALGKKWFANRNFLRIPVFKKMVTPLENRFLLK